jgi:DNA polymerase-1
LNVLVNNGNIQCCLEKLKGQVNLGLDTETYGVEFNDRLFALQISIGEGTFYFNFHDYGPGVPCLDRRILQDIGYLFGDTNKTWYIHNAKFDLRRLALEGIYIAGSVHCTQMAERFIYNQHSSYSLDACLKRIGLKKDDAVEKYIKDNKLWEWEEKPGRKSRSKKKFYDQVPFEIMFEYGCWDAEAVLKLGLQQREKLKGERYYENDLELEKICYRMEESGIKVRKDYARGGYNYEISQKEACEHDLSTLAGEPYKSGPKWLAATFDKFGVEYKRNERTNNPMFDKKELAKIDHPIVDKIIGYRRHEKYAGTYYATYAEQEVVHAFIKTWGTDTGRFSYAEPNLQNVPKEEELDTTIPFQVRGCFEPREDHCFVMVDFDQQEFRLLLDYAGEHELIRKINDHGEDVHQATADMVGVTRKMAKTLNFGLLYGMGAEKLAAALNISVLDAKSIKKQYFARLPRVQRFIREVIDTAARRGYIKTWVGRKLYFPDSDYAYKAPNHLIQGGCGDIARHAMVELQRRILDDTRSRMLLQVHDELLFEVHKSELDIIDGIVNIMENTYEPFNGMRLTCGVEHSWESWGKRYVKEGKPVLQGS